MPDLQVGESQSYQHQRVLDTVPNMGESAPLSRIEFLTEPRGLASLVSCPRVSLDRFVLLEYVVEFIQDLEVLGLYSLVCSRYYSRRGHRSKKGHDDEKGPEVPTRVFRVDGSDGTVDHGGIMQSGRFRIFPDVIGSGHGRLTTLD